MRMAPELKRELRMAKRTTETMVTNEATGRPWTVTGFDHAFAEIRAKAGIPNSLWFRDLRRTALTEAGAGGATVPQLQAMSGHRTVSQLQVYVNPTSEAADAAMDARNRSRAKVATRSRKSVATEPK